jgi:hypothetical protein
MVLVTSDSLPRACTATLATCLLAAFASAEPTPETPPKRVIVRNIGLHIGGGPNDAATKAPFKKAIEAAFDEFARCHERAETDNGTFGVDLLVSAQGGKAEVSAPRTSMRGDAFRQCVVAAFGAVEFGAPKRGATRLSYSLAFSVGE